MFTFLDHGETRAAAAILRRVGPPPAHAQSRVARRVRPGGEPAPWIQ